MSNEEFRQSCRNASVLMDEIMLRNITKACLVIEREAKNKCSVDQGPLRAAMFHNVELGNGKIKGYVGNSMEYAPYVHNGTGIYAKDGNGRRTPWKYKVESGKYAGWHITKGQKPKPFLEKAKLESINTIKDIFREGLR